MEHSLDTPLYSIGTVARMLGISVHTMRMYERSGLIVPYKRKTNQRLYSERDVDRLRCIRNAIKVEKMSIEGIRRMLSLIPCWAIAGCTEADQADCPAYNGHHEPCWSLKKKGAFCNSRDCRTCITYRDHGDCGSIKNRIREILKQQTTTTNTATIETEK